MKYKLLRTIFLEDNKRESHFLISGGWEFHKRCKSASSPKQKSVRDNVNMYILYEVNGVGIAPLVRARAFVLHLKATSFGS